MADIKRLSDTIVEALNLALKQKDVVVAAPLVKALEISMTRGTGGESFYERREYPENIRILLDKLDALQDESESAA